MSFQRNEIAVGIRRGGREAAMRILYSMEFSGRTAQDAATDYWTTHKVSDQLHEFTENILYGVERRRQEMDAIINKASENWTLARMAAVDRNIIRVAVYELLECPEVPTAVVIDEAVEIAKQYAAPEAPSFINGILGKIQKVLRKTE